MLPAKIKLTDKVIHNIKTARIAKRIPAAVLSKAINRDDSYISSLELKRLRTISSADLVSCISYLFGIPEHDAEAKAEELIGLDKNVDSNSDYWLNDTQSNHGGTDIMAVGEAVTEYNKYNPGKGYAEPELISDMLDTLAGLITDVYLKDPKEVVYALSSFIKSMQFDPMFTLDVMGIPFYTLRALSIEERKDVLADLSSVFKRHSAVANQKTD